MFSPDCPSFPPLPCDIISPPTKSGVPPTFFSPSDLLFFRTEPKDFFPGPYIIVPFFWDPEGPTPCFPRTGTTTCHRTCVQYGDLKGFPALSPPTPFCAPTRSRVPPPPLSFSNRTPQLGFPPPSRSISLTERSGSLRILFYFQTGIPPAFPFLVNPQNFFNFLWRITSPPHLPEKSVNSFFTYLFFFVRLYPFVLSSLCRIFCGIAPPPATSNNGSLFLAIFVLLKMCCPQPFFFCYIVLKGVADQIHSRRPI